MSTPHSRMMMAAVIGLALAGVGQSVGQSAQAKEPEPQSPSRRAEKIQAAEDKRLRKQALRRKGLAK